MDQQDRNCLLPTENKDSNLTNNYSKSGCQYECILKKAMKERQCVPWNVPRILPDSFEYCPVNEYNNPFIESMEQLESADCKCPADCSRTFLSVFESKTPLRNPGYYCSQTRIYKKKQLNIQIMFCAIYVSRLFKIIKLNLFMRMLSMMSLIH